MRNLKRALSLALASVMLLGMMVIGTSAASNFTDADEIVNTEAAAITGGLGIFAGANGEFMPEKEVTRAEMATIIVKMLYGNNYNANSFKGIDKFSDVADYQGGWAEGYINLCTSLKVFGGYPDGTFKPGQTVTTAEAASMLLSALGLNKNLGEWPLGVMTKATEIKLFGDLKLTAETKLTRDNLSVLVLNGLEYTPNGGTVYVVNGLEFDNLKDAALYGSLLSPAQTPVPTKTTEGSLADTVYGLKSATGVITANQATGEKVTKIASATVDADGKITALAAAGAAVSYNTKTDLDMIGHVVTVYYKTTGEKGTVYSVVDKSKVVTVASDISDSATKMAAAFGKGTDDAAAVYNFTNYAGTKADAITDFTKDTSAKAGTYVLFGGEVVSFVAPAANVLVVGKVTNYKAPTAKATGSVTITGLDADGAIGATAAITLQKVGSTTADKVKLYDGIAKDDYVYVTKIGTTAAVVVKAEVVTEAITARSSDNKKVTVAGKEYSVVEAIGGAGMVTANNSSLSTLGLTAVSSATLGTTTYNVVLTADGKVLGYYDFVPGSEANNYAVIQGISVVKATGTASWSGNDFKPATAQVKLALADGTSAVYSIKMTEEQTKQTNETTLKTALLGTLDVGSVVKYALADGVISEIKSAGADETATALKKGSTLITVNASTMSKYLTAETVFLYWDSSDTTKYTITRFVGYNGIKSTGTLAAGKIDIVFNDDNKAVFVYVDAAGTSNTTNTTKAFMKSLSYTARYDAGLKQTVYDYTAYVDGVKTTLTAKTALVSGTSIPASANAPYIVKYTLTNGYLTKVEAISSGTAKDTYVNANITYVTDDLAVAGGVEYKLAGAKVYVADKNGVVSEGSVVVSDTAKYDTYLVLNSAQADGKLSYIYYIEKAS